MASVFINFTVIYVFHKLVSNLPLRHLSTVCLLLPEQEASLLKRKSQLVTSSNPCKPLLDMRRYYTIYRSSVKKLIYIGAIYIGISDRLISADKIAKPIYQSDSNIYIHVSIDMWFDIWMDGWLDSQICRCRQTDVHYSVMVVVFWGGV